MQTSGESPREAADLGEDGVLVRPELAGLGSLLAAQPLGPGTLSGSPGLDEAGRQGPQPLLPPQHAGQRVGCGGVGK